MAADLRVFFVGVTDDAEREWRVLADVVAPPLARGLREQGVRLTTERVRLDRTCDVAALRHTADGALWVVVLGNAYGPEASMEQCLAASVTADRTPSVLDLVVRHVALEPGRRDVTVHVRELAPGASIDRRLLALRAHVDRWGDGGRAERYRVPPDLPPPEAMQQWREQLRQALARLLAARGLRVTDAPPVPPPAPARPAVIEGPPLASRPLVPPPTPAAPDEVDATVEEVVDENATRIDPWTPAEAGPAASPSPPPSEPSPDRLPTPEPSVSPLQPPPRQAGTSAGRRATGALLMIAAVLILALWFLAGGGRGRWPAVVGLTLGVIGWLVLRPARRR
jgi:hypothetical protein